MKKGFMEYWNAMLHWPGWRAMATACANAWRCTVAWGGWKKMFSLPMPLLLVMSAGCAAGLVWVFLTGLEHWGGAYALYVLSAYCLAALCVRLPGAFRAVNNWLARHPLLSGALKNEELHFKLELYFEHMVNFAYGIYKIVVGVVIGSAWVGCDGIYNFAQAMIQLFQILRRKNAGTPEKQWRAYRFCGWLLLLLHLSLTGIVFQTIHWHRVEEQGEIMVIATAAFVFYKFIHSFIELARDRRHKHPVDSSVRMLELSQSVFAVFSLQASLFFVYGTGAPWEQQMNTLTGCVVCMLVVSMGVYMLWRGSRELRTLRQNNTTK